MDNVRASGQRRNLAEEDTFFRPPEAAAPQN
jgi:hypothetical protein